MTQRVNSSDQKNAIAAATLASLQSLVLGISSDEKQQVRTDRGIEH